MANRYPLIVDSSSENIKELPAGDGLLFADNDKIVIGTGTDLTLYHDASNSYITNAVGALKIATETSGIAVTIGHTTSETTVADNLTVTGNMSIGGNFDVTGTLDFSDSALTNVGDISLDSITGDADADTAITFSGSNVITVKAANEDQVTFIDGAIVPSADDNIDLGTSSVEFKDAFFDGTVTSDAFAGPLTGAVTGNASTATTLETARTIGGVSFDGSANIAVTLAATATEATNVTASANNSTDETVYPTFVDGATGTQGIETDTGLTYNPSSGILTGTQFTGAVVGNVTGNASGTAATVTTAAQSAITSLGTLTTLTVDDINLNGKVVTMTGSTSDTAVFTAGTNGTLSIVTTDDAAAAANIQITADGTVDIDSAGVLTLDSGAAINLEPASGSAIVLDGTISVDAGVVTGATSITSTAFVGALTGNASGTAATVTTAAQTNITSLGTLTALTVDDVAIDGKVVTMTGSSGDTATVTVGTNGTLAITTVDTAAAAANMTLTADGTFEAVGTTITLDSGGAINLEPASGSAILLDGTISVDAGVVTGATSITSTAFVGAVTGNADTATLATTATVSDSTANTNFPVVFNNESNALLDDTGALRYNPSTGTLLAPNLVVAGTTTTANTVTMEAQNAVIFEGATADEYETTLSIVDPTADHTQYLINQGGYIPLLAAATTTAITSTPAELNIVDGGTSATGTTLADADRLVVNDNGTMVQVALTDLETYMETSLDTLSNVTTVGTIGSGVWQGTAIASAYIAADAITGAKIADDAIDSEHYTNASIDNAHLADDAVDSDEIAAGAIDLAHMSVNSIDSDQYVDGSIDLVHMSANSVDSDQYVDGSIDAAHLAAAQTNITSVGTLSSLTLGGDLSIPSKLIHVGDTDTYTEFDGADQWRVVTGGAERFAILGGNVVVNDDSADMDFRVESNGNANMLFVDGGSDAVGIGTTTATARLNVNGVPDGNNYTLYLTDGVNTGLVIQHAAGEVRQITSGTADLVFNTGSERFRFTTDGEIGIGGTNYGSDGQVLTSGGAGAAAAWETPTGASTGKAIAMAIVFG